MNDRDQVTTPRSPQNDAPRRRAHDVVPRKNSPSWRLRVPSLPRQTRLIAGRFLLFGSLAK
jgi:hypothetical protein